MRLLVTRPEPDGERTAAKLRARGHEVLCAPLLRVDVIPGADVGDGPWSGLILTSVNAVRAIGHHGCDRLATLPVFAVGARTAAAARAAGLCDVTSAEGDRHDLVRLIASRIPPGSAPLLYLAAVDRSGDIAGDLAAQGIAVRTVVAYRAIAAGELGPDIREALISGTIGGVLHFSRRSADIYLACAQRSGVLDLALAPTHYCLSQQVAAPIVAAAASRVQNRSHGGAQDRAELRVQIAARPDEAALLDRVPAA